MKKLKLFIILLLIACTLTGCWDQKIYEKVGFIFSVGVEEGGNGLAVTYVSPEIDPEQQGGKMAEVSMADGVTLTREARERAKLTTTKSLEAGLLQQYLFSCEIAASGIEDFLTLFERDATNPVQPHLVIVDGSPREVFIKANEFKSKPRPAVYLKELLEHAEENSKASDIRIYNFDINYFSGGIDSIVPMIKLEPEQVKIIGSALFHKDKMVGRINDGETPILLALMGKMKKTEYVCKTINISEVDPKKIVGAVVTLRNPKRKIKIKIENGKPIVNIALNLMATYEEGKWGLDFADKKIKADIESKIAANIKDDCMLVLNKCQEVGSDPIGIGDILRANYPEYWNNTTWLHAYQEAVFNVNVNVHVDIHGMIN